ncbi:MAG: HDOD domain-containing protein [Betaproteobacteria bacterium]|nr:HDOD domain-containing protein [Betaproteobacteria bacterium]
MVSTHTQELTKNATDTSSRLSVDNCYPLSTKDKLLEAISNDPDLPALGSSISRIVQLSSSDEESIRKLAYYVLSDVSLTQKILRLANSVTFRTASNIVVTSITKAIFLLGFNTVKTCALAMLLVDGMSGKRAEHVRAELTYALAASMVGRELANQSYFKDAEEIAVAALFRNLGRLLLAAYDQDQYQVMMTLIKEDSLTPAQASMQVLNFSLERFSETILEQWDIPSSIIQAIKTKPGRLRVPKSHQEWMQQAAELSEKVVPLIFPIDESADADLEEELLSRFGQAFEMDRPKLRSLITKAANETRALGANAQLTSDDDKEISVDAKNLGAEAVAEVDILGDLVFESEKPDAPEIIQCHPSGKPFNADALLLAGVQDVTEVMAVGEYKLNDLIMLVLETLHNCLGFRFITLCLRDSSKNQFRARSSLGKNNMHYQKDFVFSAVLSDDLFCLSMERNVDLLISDTTVKKVRKLRPQWHIDLLPDANSFIVLPLVINKSPVGLVYADREHKAPEGITSEEMRLIKTLKGQVLAALNKK